MAATNLYVRKTGSAANGGSSVNASPDATGADGVTNGTTTFTAASGTFSAGDVDKFINIVGKGRYRIVARASNTSITLSGTATSGSSLTWNLGGACLNIGDLLQAAAGTIVNGDAIWIGAGTYRETITCTNTNTAEVTVNCDADGAKTGDFGQVILSGWTTSDKAAPSSSILISLNNHDFLTFKNFVFIPGTSNVLTGGTDATNIKCTDCVFLGTRNNGMITVTASFGTALNWTFDRCIFHAFASFANFTATTAAAGSDYDMNVVFKNCLFHGINPSINVLASGTAIKRGNGVHLFNCTLINGLYNSNSANLSATIANVIKNCIFVVASAALTANASGGLITEDWNIIHSLTPRTNVSAGANSISTLNYLPSYSIGQERIYGAQLRPFGEPTIGSPLLAFGNDGSQTAYDLRNNPRPAGGLSTNPGVGAMERGNTFGKETGTVHTGSNAISVTGPGYQDFLIPVDASSTTFTIYARYDATYAGTRPQVLLLANGEIGVAAQTVTATVAASGAWEQQTIGPFTPTRAGFVTLRVVSNDTNGGGKAFFDTFAAA